MKFDNHKDSQDLAKCQGCKNSSFHFLEPVFITEGWREKAGQTVCSGCKYRFLKSPWLFLVSLPSYRLYQNSESLFL